MTLKFTFGYTRKDGTSNLEIRFKDNGRDSRIKVKGVSFDKKFWDQNLQRVNYMHPNSDDLNDRITKFYNKIIDVKYKYQLGNISYDTAVKMLGSSSSFGTIMEFIESHCLDTKSQQTLKNYKMSVNGFALHTGIKNPTFTDITFANIIKVKKSINNKGLSPHTHNKYLRDLKAICNYAKRLKVVFIDFEFDKEWRAKTPPQNKITTVQPFEIKEAIDRIQIKSSHRSAKQKALREFEAVGLWLLMFSMRGMYQSDIVSLSSHNLDYNFESRIKIEQASKEDNGVNLKGNFHVYHHLRSKTEIPMKIIITIPPISGLIHVLRILVAATHPKASFLNEKDIQAIDYFEKIKGKDPKKVDFIKIFNYDHDKDNILHDNIWNNYSKRLRGIGMPSFKTARKSFMTTATIIDIPQAIGKTMLGQLDPSISAHYNNYDDPQLFLKVSAAHLAVLNAFSIIELFDFWLKKMDMVFSSNWNELLINADSKRVYSDFQSRLKQIISVTNTNIDQSRIIF